MSAPLTFLDLPDDAITEICSRYLLLLQWSPAAQPRTDSAAMVGYRLPVPDVTRVSQCCRRVRRRLLLIPELGSFVRVAAADCCCSCCGCDWCC